MSFFFFFLSILFFNLLFFFQQWTNEHRFTTGFSFPNIVKLDLPGSWTKTTSEITATLSLPEDSPYILDCGVDSSCSFKFKLEIPETKFPVVSYSVDWQYTDGERYPTDEKTYSKKNKRRRIKEETIIYYNIAYLIKYILYIPSFSTIFI